MKFCEIWNGHGIGLAILTWLVVTCFPRWPIDISLYAIYIPGKLGSWTKLQIAWQGLLSIYLYRSLLYNCSAPLQQLRQVYPWGQMLELVSCAHVACGCVSVALDLATQQAAYMPERRHSITVCESPTMPRRALTRSHSRASARPAPASATLRRSTRSCSVHNTNGVSTVWMDGCPQHWYAGKQGPVWGDQQKQHLAWMSFTFLTNALNMLCLLKSFQC